jgi:hypothetical protein
MVRVPPNQVKIMNRMRRLAWDHHPEHHSDHHLEVVQGEEGKADDTDYTLTSDDSMTSGDPLPPATPPSPAADGKGSDATAGEQVG